jgi:hypothetical protein
VINLSMNVFERKSPCPLRESKEQIVSVQTSTVVLSIVGLELSSKIEHITENSDKVSYLRMGVACLFAHLLARHVGIMTRAIALC